MRPAIPQNKPHDYSWSIISNRHLKKGQSNLSLKECVRIKKILGTNKTVDYLFEEGGEKTGGG